MVDTWPLLINCYLDLIRLILQSTLKLLADGSYVAFTDQLLSWPNVVNMVEYFKATG